MWQEHPVPAQGRRQAMKLQRLVNSRHLNIYGEMKDRKVEGGGESPNHEDTRKPIKNSRKDHMARFEFLED